MDNEIIEILKSDNIKVFKSWRIRALSPLWWVVRITECSLVLGAIYVMYIGLWLLVG